MTEEQLREEIKNQVDNYGTATIVTSADEYYEIGKGDNWIGGTEDDFMCDVMGNVAYSTLDSCITAVINYLAEDNITIDDVE